ncbi:MAG TPA: hypothetical protein VFX86_03640 [Candidatus Saccharimonadales bacterium]|nr:hypothetical protein [Candidatus Saccharimonadales bacterium]
MTDIPNPILPIRIPSFEALEARVSPSELDIFVKPIPRGSVSVIGDYVRNSDELPPQDSPLSDLRTRVDAFREQIPRRDTDERLSDEARRLLLATKIQLNLIGYINRGHQNLIAVGYSPDEIPGTLKDFITEQDAKAAKAYEDPPVGGGHLRANDGTVISLDMVFKGQEAGSETKSRNALLRERLEFEWMSSLAIVAALEQGFKQEAA